MNYIYSSRLGFVLICNCYQWYHLCVPSSHLSIYIYIIYTYVNNRIDNDDSDLLEKYVPSKKINLQKIFHFISSHMAELIISYSMFLINCD